MHDFEDIWLEARRTFLPLGGVVGVGYGPKVSRGKVVARQAIVILVDKKLPEAKLASGQAIPLSFRGLPTDVRVPSLAPAADEDDEDAAGVPPPDYCLTDYQWIDWVKIHRRWSESAPEGRPTRRG